MLANGMIKALATEIFRKHQALLEDQVRAIWRRSLNQTVKSIGRKTSSKEGNKKVQRPSSNG
ncbi:hypothetical protein MMC31_006997, partial [Peltigera leucophlebia]|nr:hypothetical protein [Peltigera leucophlebia]